MNIQIRKMELKDYENVYGLWNEIQGFGIRSIDDSREGMERFLERNPSTSVVAEQNGKIVGAVMCGHDGRTGCLYHVCVSKDYRKHGVGENMVKAALLALKKEKINKVTLIAFRNNEGGNAFWKELGWSRRQDVNYYDLVLNEQNITRFIMEPSENEENDFGGAGHE